jgi:UDP-N-acetylmuramoyl-tripeptide--D-alanyl-D-alanine ligase
MFKVIELLKAVRGKFMCGDINTSIKGISIDTRTIKRQEVFIAIKGLKYDGHNFINRAIKKGAKAIIAESIGKLDKDLLRNITVIKVKDTVITLGDLARFHRQKFNIPIIVITGSNGKTTTKEMLFWVLTKNFKVLKNYGTKNNHIGLPLTLLELNHTFDMAVLEAGTNHPGEIDYLAGISSPNIAIITNIGPAHLEYLKDLNGVFQEKISLLNHLKKPYIAILNSDDQLLNRISKRKGKKSFILGFGMQNKTDFFATEVKNLSARPEFLVNQNRRFTLKTPGSCNIYNALAAISIARIFGMDYKDIADRLSTFSLPENRLNLIKLDNIRFINDTYNSNPSSLKQALDVLDKFQITGRKIFVMGDMLELGSYGKSFHRMAGERVAHICDVFITVGRLSKFAADTAGRNGFNKRNIFTCESTQEAKGVLFNKILPGPDDVVLVKGSRSMKMEEIFNNR